MIPVPYFEQGLDHSCGPAVLRMVLRYYGITVSEEELIEKLKPHKKKGTKHSDMIELLQKNGLHTYANEGSTLEEMAYFVRREYPVIVHFIEPSSDWGHFAVVIGFRHGEIVLNDPWNGKKFKMSVKDFEERWKSEPIEGDYHRWLMAVSDKNISYDRRYASAESTKVLAR